MHFLNAVFFFIAFKICFFLLIKDNVFGFKEIEVPVKTQILLRLIEPISPDIAEEGESLYFTAAEDVLVNGHCVIKEGAIGIGKIQEITRRNFLGIPARIYIKATSIKAVDGTYIPISGKKLTQGEDRKITTAVMACVSVISLAAFKHTRKFCLLGLLFCLMRGGGTHIPQGAQVKAITTATTKIRVDVKD
jgi:hypothetical protein